MEIKETTQPTQRTFNLSVTAIELSEIRIAFGHMLSLDPQWYCNTQKENVKVMHDKIVQMLRSD